MTCSYCGKEIDFRKGEVYLNDSSYVCEGHALRRLDIKGILRDPLSRQALHDMAVAGVISRLTHTPHTIPLMDYDTRHKIFETMERFGGGFCRKLAVTWFAADTRNKERIETAFPDYVAQYGPESQFWDK